MQEKVKLINFEKNEIISEILSNLFEIVPSKKEIVAIEKNISPNITEKSELVYEIIISLGTGIAVSIIYDLLKSIILTRVSNHPKFKKTLKLQIDNKVITIEELLIK